MALKALFKKNVLYFPGCFCKSFLPDIVSNYQEILTSLGVKFLRLNDIEVCCGNPSLISGYLETFDELHQQNSEVIKNQRLRKIITNCPSCAKTFSQYYNIETENVTTTILQRIEYINKNYENEEITLHICCDANQNPASNDEVKKILEKIGFKVVVDNGQCCGSHGLLKENVPNIANEIANKTLKSIKTKKLIVHCPWCYKQLKENSKNVQILELSEVLK